MVRAGLMLPPVGDTEAENAERHGHSDCNRCQSAAAPHGGVQDRADEKPGTDSLDMNAPP